MENSIKHLAFEQVKVHSVLKAIDHTFTQDGRLEPELVGNMFLQITDFMLKNNITLEQLPATLQRIYDELNNLNEEIKNRKRSIRELQKRKINALAANRVTRRDLNHTRRIRKCFEQVGLDIEKEDEVKNVLSNIQEMNFSVPKIIDELKEKRGLKDSKSELEQNIRSLQNIALMTSEKIEEQEKHIGYLGPAKDVIIKLLQRGIHPDVITGVFDIVRKHPPAFLESPSKDVDTYGGIEAAIFYKRTEYNFLVDAVANLEAQRNALLNNNNNNYNNNNNVTDFTNATRHNGSGNLLV